MFGNLVQIELIRLIKSTALKISAAIAVFLIFFCMILVDYVQYLGGFAFINNDVLTPPMIEISVFTVIYFMAASVVAPVTVIFTTCSYQTSRLSVNIEGAVRNRLKLCLTELAGIALLDVILSLMMFPVIVIMCLSYRSELNPMDLLSELDIVYMFISMTLSNLYGCLIAYLISKFTSNPMLAMAVSILYSVVSYAGIIFLTGFVSGNGDNGIIIPDSLRDVFFYIVLSIPIIALSIALAVRYKKADRI